MTLGIKSLGHDGLKLSHHHLALSEFFGYLIRVKYNQWFAMAFLVENLQGLRIHPLTNSLENQFGDCHNSPNITPSFTCSFRGNVTLSHAPSMAHHQAMNQQFIPCFGWSNFPEFPVKFVPSFPNKTVLKQ